MSLFRRSPPQPEGLDEKTRQWFAEPVPVDGAWPQGETQPRYEALRCQWCQGIHFRACPRVESIEYHDNGHVKKVQYWPAGAYDDSDTVYPEMIFTEDPGPTQPGSDS